MTLGSTSESGPSLIRQPVILRRIPWPAGNGHFQQSVVQEAVDASSEVSASTGMASGCNQRFGRDGAVERRSKHSDLFRRQCGLALLALLAPCMAPDLAPGMARLYSCSALGRTVTSECRRISTSWCYSHPHDLPGHLPQICCPANRGDECIGDGELGFRQVGLNAAPNHVQGFRSHAFDVLGQVQRLRQQGIAGQPEPGNPAPCPPRKPRTRGTARGQYIAAPGPWASPRPPSCRR